MISSPLMDGEYERLVPDYEEYRHRKLVLEEDASLETGPNGEDGR
jgi:hypothetical protein